MSTERSSALLAFALCPLLILTAAEDKRSYRIISAEALLAKVKSERPILLIDCRPEDEYRAGHIPRATNVSIDSFSFSRETVVKRSLQDIENKIGKRLAVVLIDADSGEEYMPQSKLAELLKQLPEDRSQEVILYCRKPECTRSPLAARWALILGYRNVWRYEGGWKEWAEKNLPVEK